MIELHPYCAAWQPMPQEDLVSLSKSIAEQGLLRPVVLFDGKVLDGQNRQLACEIAGVAFETIEFSGTEDEAYAYVLISNDDRRHDTPVQRSMARFAMAEARGVIRLKQGDAKAQVESARQANLPVAESVAASAAAAGHSERTERDVQTVLRSDNDALKKDMAAGKVAPSAAARKVRAERDGEVATPPPAPAPGPVEVKDTPEQKLKKRIKRLEAKVAERDATIAERDAEIVTLKGEVEEWKDRMSDQADAVVELNETVVALQALRDNEHVVLITKLQARLRAAEAERDTTNTTREVMRRELSTKDRRIARLEGTKK